MHSIYHPYIHYESIYILWIRCCFFYTYVNFTPAYWWNFRLLWYCYWRMQRWFTDLKLPYPCSIVHHTAVIIGHAKTVHLGRRQSLEVKKKRLWDVLGSNTDKPVPVIPRLFVIKSNGMSHFMNDDPFLHDTTICWERERERERERGFT